MLQHEEHPRSGASALRFIDQQPTAQCLGIREFLIVGFRDWCIVLRNRVLGLGTQCLGCGYRA